MTLSRIELNVVKSLREVKAVISETKIALFIYMPARILLNRILIEKQKWIWKS